MARITEKERSEMHTLLDMCLNKLDSEKNIKKVHWSKLTFIQLQKMEMIESHELDLAVHNKNGNQILSECKDIINFVLFIMHNLFKKQGKL